MAAERRADVVDRAGNRVGQVDRLEGELERAGLDAGHVEQVGDEALEPRRLGAERGEGGVGRAVAGTQVGGGRDDGGQRRAEVVPDAGEQRRAQPVALLERGDAGHLALGMDAGQREPGLIDECREQAALVGTDRIAAVVAAEAEHGARRTGGGDGHEQPIGGGQRVGPAAGGQAAIERPVAGGERDGVDVLVGRDGGDDRQRPVAARQIGGARVEQRRRLARQRLGQRDLVGGSGQRPGKTGQRRILPRRGRGQRALRPDPRRELAGDDRDAEQDDDRHEVLRIGDGEGIDRRQEEEVIRQRRQHAGRDAGQQAVEQVPPP